MTLIEANKRLWLELDSGTRALYDASSLAKKTEVDLEKTHKREGRNREVCRWSSYRARDLADLRGMVKTFLR